MSLQIFYIADCYNADNVPKAINLLKSKWTDNSIMIGGGDYFGSGALSNMDRGSLMLEVMCDLKMTVSAIGNHEFDFGVERALELFKEGTDCGIRFVCSNLRFRDPELNRLDQADPNSPPLIVKTLIKEMTNNGKPVKIGIFALLDKNTPNKTDSSFADHFELDTNINKISQDCVTELQERGADFIIAISHMDGYHAQLSDVDQITSNALDCIVEGVDLILDASNHESVSGNIFKDLFRGSQKANVSKMPGYCMGGVDLDYLNLIVLDQYDLKRHLSYFMYNTNSVEADGVTQIKYNGFIKKYLAQAGFQYHQVTLTESFDLSEVRTYREKVFVKKLFQLTNTIWDQLGKWPLDLMILPTGKIRLNKLYREGEQIDTYEFRKIFGFGLNVVFFLLNPDDLVKFSQTFTEPGLRPIYFPENLANLVNLDKPLVCCLDEFLFNNGNGYPFYDPTSEFHLDRGSVQQIKVKVLGQHDIFDYAVNVNKLQFLV